MKKQLLNSTVALLLGVFLIPSVAFASWWNPFTWFSNSSTGNNTKTEVLEKRIAELESKLNTNATSTVSATSTSIENTEPQPDFKTLKPVVTPSPKKTVPKPKVVSPVIDSSAQSSVQSSPTGTLCNGVYYSACGVNTTLMCPADGGKAYCLPAQPTGILCNGTYYSACSSEQKFICPTSGKASCQNPQSAADIQLQAIMDKYDQQAKDRATQEAQRQNSSECQAAKSELASIESRYNNMWSQYKAAPSLSKESSEYLSQATDLALKQSEVQNKKYLVCDNFVPTPPKMYNTSCYGTGSSINCTTY